MTTRAASRVARTTAAPRGASWVEALAVHLVFVLVVVFFLVPFIWLFTGLAVLHPFYRSVGGQYLARLSLPDGLRFFTLGWWVIHLIAVVLVFSWGYRKGRRDERRERSPGPK